MFKQRLFIIVLITIHLFNVESQESFHSQQNFSASELPYLFHTVASGQTIYSLSVLYNTTVEAIYKLNPESKNGVRVGDNIKIPQLPKKKAVANALNIALLLPFGTIEKEEDSTNQSQRLVEYYEGFLLSLDSLKKNGLSVNLNVYDIGNRPESLQAILNKPELKNNQMLIGGRTAEQIKSIADYALSNTIWYVVPFSSKADETLANPYVFQINPPQSHLYDKVSRAVVNKYKDHNIIFINMQDTSKNKLIQTLQTDLSTNRQSYKSLTYNAATFNSDIRRELSGAQKNVIILSSAASDALIKVMLPLRILKEVSPDLEISLFGYPEWQTYFKNHIDDFFLTNTCLYSVFYADNTDAEIKRFINAFKSWYGKTPINTYPKYSILGYDTGMYFVQLFQQFGTNAGSSQEPIKYQGLQTGFDFKRIGNWSGFVNSNVFLIDFLPDYSIRRTMVK